MIIIFDTFGGLCNQFYDINCGINFCVFNNFKFSFRYCSFRHKNLTSWYCKKFHILFDTELFKKYEDLYVDFQTLELTDDNTYNLQGITANEIFTDDYLNEIKQIKKEYVVLKQFWVVDKFDNIVYDIYTSIMPSKRLMNVYETIKQNLLPNNESYNFIHYRYEKDFTDFFKVNIESLNNIIVKIKRKFNNPNLKIYIATSNIKSLNLHPSILPQIITKNEYMLKSFNYEELAFIDFMFGIHSNEVFGHRKSAFSVILNHIKHTNNYYEYESTPIVTAPIVTAPIVTAPIVTAPIVTAPIVTEYRMNMKKLNIGRY